MIVTGCNLKYEYMKDHIFKNVLGDVIEMISNPCIFIYLMNNFCTGFSPQGLSLFRLRQLTQLLGIYNGKAG